MAAKLAIPDDRYAVCTVCHQRKRLVFNQLLDLEKTAHALENETGAPGFSPSQSRMMPFERRCYTCNSAYRAKVASYTSRRIKLPRSSTVWEAAEDAALHVVLGLVVDGWQAAGVIGCKPYPATPGALRPALRHVGDFDRDKGRTALHLALLSRADAYLHGLVVDGWTVKGEDIRFEMVCTLLEYGADPDAGTVIGRDRPLAMAAALGDRRLVEALLAHGADPLRVDRWGRTPLHSAQSQEAVHILVREGVQTSTRDKAGRTALQLAVANGDNDGRTKLLQRLAERRTDGEERRAQALAAEQAARRKDLEAKREQNLDQRASKRAKDVFTAQLKRASAAYERDRLERLGTVIPLSTSTSPPKTANPPTMQSSTATGNANPTMELHYQLVLSDRRVARERERTKAEAEAAVAAEAAKRRSAGTADAEDSEEDTPFGKQSSAWGEVPVGAPAGPLRLNSSPHELTAGPKGNCIRPSSPAQDDVPPLADAQAEEGSTASAQGALFNADTARTPAELRALQERVRRRRAGRLSLPFERGK